MSRILLLAAALLAAGVAVASPQRGDAAEIVYATGVVEPRTWAKVAPLLRERIVDLCNCEGEAVERGAVLARLDSRQPEASLAELRARQKFAAGFAYVLPVAARMSRANSFNGRSAASCAAIQR